VRPGDDRESSVTSPSSSRDPNSWNSLPEPPSSAILELVADLSEEFSKREALMHALASEFAQKAVLTSSWLSRVDFGWALRGSRTSARDLEPVVLCRDPDHRQRSQR